MLVALALLGLSLSHLASGVAIVTGSGERDGWLMAVGIDMGFVALELALLVAPATTRPAVARYASPAIVGTLAIGGDERLCVRLACARLDDFPGNRPRFRHAGIGLRPDQNRGDYVFRTGLAMRLFQTMIFADRPREGVRLALTTLASGAIPEIYPRGINPETMVPLVLVHVSQSDVDRARRACEAFEREMMGGDLSAA
jgi:hypothetical protein